MKFSIDKNKLISILTEFSNILRENPVKPIVAGLKIKAENNKITFIGTNLEINYIRETEEIVEESGSVVIKPPLLLEYIKLLDEDRVEIFLKDNSIKVHHATFSVLSDESYPIITIPKIKSASENDETGEFYSTKVFSINGDQFVKFLEKSKFAASTSKETIAVNCVRLVLKSDYIEMVSTDSHRLLYLKEDIKSEMEKEASIPLDTVNTICKLLKDYNKEINIGFAGDILTISWDNAELSSKITAIPFPDYRAIIKKTLSSDAEDSNRKSMEFNKGEIADALKRVITVAKTNTDSKFGARFFFKDKLLEINVTSGKGKINQKVHMIKAGEDFFASLNCKYFAEYLDNIGDNPFVKGTDAGSMFEIIETGKENYKYILMPLAMK